MKDWFNLLFSWIGLLYIWGPLSVVLIMAFLVVGKYEYCNDKYNGFSAASCFFSDKTRY